MLRGHSQVLSGLSCVEGLPGRVGRLLFFFPVLGTAVSPPCPHPQLPCRQICCEFRAGEKKRYTRVQGLLFIYIKTLTSATVPPLSKQQLPVQARLCLQTCVLRDPPTLLWELQGQGREEQPREAELGSRVLLPLLWECCWQLLSLPACPFLLPPMSELKIPPTPHARRTLQPPPGPGRLRSCGLVTNSSTLRAGQPGHAGCGFGSQVTVGAVPAPGAGGAGRRRMQLEWPPGRTEVLIRVRCCCRAPLCAQRQLGLPSGRGFATGPEGALNHKPGVWHCPVSLSLSPFLKVPQRLCYIP